MIEPGHYLLISVQGAEGEGQPGHHAATCVAELMKDKRA